MLNKLDNKQIERLIKNILDAKNDKEQLSLLLADFNDCKLPNRILKEVFLAFYPPNEQGYSETALMDDLIKIHPSFRTTNGGDWCRSNSSPLGKEFVIERIKKGGSIYSIKLDGKNKNVTQKYRGISERIRKALKNKKCVVLQVGTNIEIDHKNGKYNDRELEDSKTQKLEDFQPLSKSVNDAKRQHCKKCKESGERFDAKRLGYSESYIMGNSKSENCDGCYWHDPYKFNEIISRDFTKTY